MQTDPRLNRIQQYIARMPSLSPTATKVLQICNNPATSPADLGRVITMDPVLTAKVLKVVNSAYYAAGAPIYSMVRAIILLGLNTVKNLVLAASAMDVFRHAGRDRTWDGREFWRHCLLVGVTARTIAQELGLAATEREEYFIAGLLHDLGKIPLMDLFPAEYAAVRQRVDPHKASVVAAEREILGWDHGRIGRRIAEKWNLQPAIQETLGCHHEPLRASDVHRVFVARMAVADAVAHCLAVPDGAADNPTVALEDGLRDAAGVQGLHLPAFGDSVRREVEKAEVFLTIDAAG